MGDSTIDVTIKKIGFPKNFGLKISTAAKLNVIFSFEFWIIAADSVHSERAKVSILVLDENDNEPDVFVAFTKPHLSIPNSGLYLLHKVPQAIYGSMIREIDFSIR